MSCNIASRSRIVILVFISLLFCCVFSVQAESESPAQKLHVPTYFPFKFGQMQITALYDGNIPVPRKILFNASRLEMEELLARNFITGEIPSSVNAYLIDTGSKLILVDTGAGDVLSSALKYYGHLTENIEKAGYKPDQINAILITHCHRDHLGGLLDSKDKPVFPNATVYVPKVGYEFWSNKENESKYPERFLPYFKLTQKLAPIFLAMDKWKTYADGENPIPDVPEIRAIATPGHAPGLSAFEITSEGKKFVIWGDIIHVAALQMPKPEITVIYDLDPEQAAASRLSILKYVAAAKALVAGMHLPFPGIGHVRMDGVDTFSWVPVEFRYDIDKNTNEYY